MKHLARWLFAIVVIAGVTSQVLAQPSGGGVANPPYIIGMPSCATHNNRLQLCVDSSNVLWRYDGSNILKIASLGSTANIDVAAGATLDIDTSLHVQTAAVDIVGKVGGSSLTLPTTLDMDAAFTDGGLCYYTLATGKTGCDKTTLNSVSIDLGTAVASGVAVTMDANGVLQSTFDALIPDAASGATLGTASYPWGLGYFGNGATSAGGIYFYENTGNGTNAVLLQGPASTADVTVTLPAAAGTLPVVTATTTTPNLVVLSSTTAGQHNYTSTAINPALPIPVLTATTVSAGLAVISTTTAGQHTYTALSGGGDLKSDGTVAMTANFNLGGFSITGAALPLAVLTTTTTTPGLVAISSTTLGQHTYTAAGAGDFKADGTVPMTANLNLGGFSITGAALPIPVLTTTTTTAGLIPLTSTTAGQYNNSTSLSGLTFGGFTASKVVCTNTTGDLTTCVNVTDVAQIGGTLGATANALGKRGADASTIAASTITENETDIDAQALNFITKGTISGKIPHVLVNTSTTIGTSPATVTTDRVVYGGVLQYATDLSANSIAYLPTKVTGMSVCAVMLKNSQGILKAQGSDFFADIQAGAYTVTGAAGSLTLTAVTGNKVCVVGDGAANIWRVYSKVTDTSVALSAP